MSAFNALYPVICCTGLSGYWSKYNHSFCNSVLFLKHALEICAEQPWKIKSACAADHDL